MRSPHHHLLALLLLLLHRQLLQVRTAHPIWPSPFVLCDAMCCACTRHSVFLPQPPCVAVPAQLRLLIHGRMLLGHVGGDLLIRRTEVLTRWGCALNLIVRWGEGRAVAPEDGVVCEDAASRHAHEQWGRRERCGGPALTAAAAAAHVAAAAPHRRVQVAPTAVPGPAPAAAQRNHTCCSTGSPWPCIANSRPRLVKPWLCKSTTPWPCTNSASAIELVGFCGGSRARCPGTFPVGWCVAPAAAGSASGCTCGGGSFEG
mmetsp:Transcript_12661/g.33563  ORF Transcript_12661/g.33563 Transcript_12661/m.33563 type:complete len:259 (-) Transcript_12661:622-1398(-)